MNFIEIAIPIILLGVLGFLVYSYRNDINRIMKSGPLKKFAVIYLGVAFLAMFVFFVSFFISPEVMSVFTSSVLYKGIVLIFLLVFAYCIGIGDLKKDDLKLSLKEQSIIAFKNCWPIMALVVIVFFIRIFMF